jgi:hypothetical protein
MSATLSRGLRSEIERRFCESVGTDSRDSGSRGGQSGASGRDVRNFFSRRQTASRRAICRRTGAREIAVKGGCERVCANPHTPKKFPVHRHFLNRSKFARRLAARRGARAAQDARGAIRVASKPREAAARTRFVNAEAVFFVLL